MARPHFDAFLTERGHPPLYRTTTTTLQVNAGPLCNQACHHCHVDAGPHRREIMSAAVAARVLALLARSHSVGVLDLTGGAPELNPSFRRMVTEARRLGRRVIDRCNLTVLLEPGMESMADFLAANGVEIVASLPCYGGETTDGQRGRGVFEKSMTALRHLNALGYGRDGSALRLDLVYNPSGPFLPPAAAELESVYKRELRMRRGVEFHRLLTITNMPIKRFATTLQREDRLHGYLGLLVDAFNPDTLDALMCRSLISVAWDGSVYDCDFNQMLGVGPRRTIWDFESLDELTGRPIATASHCFGCTAGQGSSCSGSLTGTPAPAREVAHAQTGP